MYEEILTNVVPSDDVLRAREPQVHLLLTNLEPPDAADHARLHCNVLEDSDREMVTNYQICVNTKEKAK